MELVFIGTGSGAVSPDRFHASVVIKDQSNCHLIDCGDSVCRALLQADIKYNSIQSISITHFHSDHINGLSSLITQMKMNKRSEPLKIFVHTDLSSRLKFFLEMNYIIDERLNFEIVISEFKSDVCFSPCSGIQMLARENTHLNKYFKYYKETSFLKSCSFYIIAESKRIFYTGDVGSRDDLEIFSGNDIDYMISEITHLTADDICRYYKKECPAKIFLTHINSSEMDYINKWHSGLSSDMKEAIQIVSDGYIFKI